MLVWNVWVLNFNQRKIETYNVFDHGGFWRDCQKAAKKFAKDPDGFAEEVRHSLMYWYWSKCEWEIILQSWPPSERVPDIKIDVYDQIMINKDVFFPWLWEHRAELKSM